LIANGAVCVTDSAAGCADVTPPRHTWMRRTGDVVEVGCPTSRKRWTLTCVDGQWDGEVDAVCHRVPGVRLPWEIDLVDAQPSRNETQSFWESFPVSKSSYLDHESNSTAGSI